MDQVESHQTEAYAALVLLYQQNMLFPQGDEPESGSVTVGDFGDFDLNNARSDQIASDLLVLDHSEAVLPVFEQYPCDNLSLLYTGCQYQANDESFPHSLVPNLRQTNTELQSEPQSNFRNSSAGLAASFSDWGDSSLAFNALQHSLSEYQPNFKSSDALGTFSEFFYDLEQPAGAGLPQHKFRLVPYSDTTRQIPSAGFTVIGRELSFDPCGKTKWPRCPRCRAQNRQCTRPDGEFLCLTCAKFGIPVELCNQGKITSWNPFEKWNDKTYEILFTAVRSSGTSSRKTVVLQHYPNGPTLKVECCEFIREREDQTRLLRKDSSGGHSIETTPYCLADIKFDISPYVRGYVKIVIANAFRQRPVSIFFKLASAFTDVLIIRQCFEMYTSLILIMVECQFVDDANERETLGMPTVEERDSMWYNSTPVPRMIRNQLGHLLELNIIRLNREIKSGLLKMTQKNDRKMWIVETLAAFILAHTEEVDAGRNLFWSRYEVPGRFWIHPSSPTTLIDGAIASCNSILSHFHCAIKRKPLDLNWNDQKSKDMVDNDMKVVKCMKILQSHISCLGTDGFLGRKARELYRDGDPNSIAFTITSLFFKSIQEGVYKVEDFR